MKKIPCTQEEFNYLQEDLSNLTNFERPNIIKAISSARALGDLSENAEYHSAREKQSFIEGRIKELTSIISACEIIDPKSINSNQVQFGATVTLLNLGTKEKRVYKILGEYGANPKNGSISYNSPLAKEIIGKKVNDIVDFVTGRGEQSFEILDIKYI